MPKYPEVDIFPPKGIEARDPAGVKWLGNLFRPGRGRALAVRPGFGQICQLDSTTMGPSTLYAAQTLDNPNGGYTKHLGSGVYRTNFGHTQIVSVFSCVSALSTADEVSIGASEFEGVHGYRKTVVATIFDLTTGRSFEHLLVVHTAEYTQPDNVSTAHGHFESTLRRDYRKVHVANEVVSIIQVNDGLYLCSPELGVWAYYGADIAADRIQRINSDNFDPNKLNAVVAPYKAYNNCNGYSEGSLFKPITATRGINGTHVIYLNKSQFPRAVDATLLNGRVVYLADRSIFFSDVGQPGSIMANNYVALDIDGDGRAIQSHRDLLYVFGPSQTYALQTTLVQQAGTSIPGILDAVAMRISNDVGCVNPNAAVDTPQGVAFVSARGVHLVTGQQIADISDPIVSHWLDGLVDPLNQYFRNSGLGNETAANLRQPPIIYRHGEVVAMTYHHQENSLLVSYEDHILAYQFDSESWYTWSLITSQGNAANFEALQTLNAQSVMALDGRVFVVSGLHDTNNLNETNPHTESASYALCELGIGGGLDRSVKDEDFRRWGHGSFQRWTPTQGVGGGGLPVPTTNDYVVTLNVPESYTKDAAGDLYTFMVDFEVITNGVFPGPGAGGAGHAGDLYLRLQHDAAWTFLGYEIPPESGIYTAVTVASAANIITISRDFTGAADPRPACRFPVVALKFRAPLTSTNPAFTFLSSQAWIGNVGGAYSWFNTFVWQPNSPVASRNASDNVAQSVQWAYQTGALNLGNPDQIRSKGVGTVLESHGRSGTTAHPYGLYNVLMGADGKLLSSQFPDLDVAGNVNADKLVAKAETIRQRMATGTRTFNGVSLWGAGSVTPNLRYLIDAPEVDDIVVVQASKGQTIAASMFGFIQDKAETLKMHRAAMMTLPGGPRRRTGR